MNNTTRSSMFSLARVLSIAAPLAIITAISLLYIKSQEQTATRLENEWASRRFGLVQPAENRLSDEYVDRDGDLLADRPEPGECISPKTLLFAYIPGEGPEHLAESWQELTDAIAEATERPVEFLKFDSTDEQLLALAEKKLHVTVVNTGAVPKAVNVSGFRPQFVIGQADGTFGYTMKLIVPPNSPIQQIADLKGRRITFTSTESNSGFKAPIVMLKYDHDMEPVRDYDYGFSTSHDDSIRLVASGEIQAAAVASDMLDRAIARGDIEAESIREIYSSERFPSAALGWVHNLDESLADKIFQVINEFELNRTQIPSTIGLPTEARFLPVSYKDEWALIRRTDDALGVIHRLDVAANEQPMPESTESGENEK